MNFYNKEWLRNTIVLFLVISIFSCKKDKDAIPGNPTSLTYNSAAHIYGTGILENIGRYEYIIDPATGQFDTLSGTMTTGGGFNFPIGPTKLTSFDNNQRIFISPAIDHHLILQDLTTFQYDTVEIRVDNPTDIVIFPQFIFFGSNENELYLVDTDESLWMINTENGEVERVFETLDASNEFQILNIFYIESIDVFLLATKPNGGGGTMNLMLMDRSTLDVTYETTVSESFGFVQHPDEDKIYCLLIPDGDKKFRLMEISIFTDLIVFNQKSASDLAIDELSPNLQTIHTATNSYICRGGSNAIEAPTNTLYMIDLGTGELKSGVELTDSGLILNLAGE